MVWESIEREDCMSYVLVKHFKSSFSHVSLTRIVRETPFPTRPIIGDARLRSYANGSLDEAVQLEAILEPRKSTYTLMELSVCRFGSLQIAIPE